MITNRDFKDSSVHFGIQSDTDIDIFKNVKFNLKKKNNSSEITLDHNVIYNFYNWRF